MRRPITTRTHGMIDYGWAAVATGLSKQMEGATSTAQLLRTASAVATANSLLTNYEFGALRILPMREHLAVDYALAGTLLVSPLLLPASERRHAIWPTLLGLAGLAAALLTRPRSPLELGDEFGGLYGGDREVSMVADHDADIDASLPLRHQVE
jgi:hypothetical protein